MMKRIALLLAAAAVASLPGAVVAQLVEDPFGEPMPVLIDDTDVLERKAEQAKPSRTDSESEAEPAEEKAPELDPQAIKLNLMDGSVISGKLEVKEIEVSTKFGKLTVPVSSIRSFKPGLDSYPDLKEEVEGLIERLGSEDYAERETARKTLARMGSKVEAELKRHVEDENAERVRQIKAILEELATVEEFSEEEEETSSQAWSRLDTVVTTDFTIVGNISPKSFKVTSQYGPLDIQLAHIRSAERDSGAKVAIRKSLSVPGQNLAQLAFKNSGIRLQRGDRVSVTAEGSIIMTPWGNTTSSTPDGGQNFGIYQDQIWGGSLVARIGDSGKVFKVGSKNTFEADRAGTLQFAIAMQHDYGQGNYQFPGEYKLKIKVDPK